ncbi:MAG TPA: sugar ABC transporter ATP-binding protein [Fimbriimonadaceae bacterium]|nr:sugar ABC transporter ATP-binding protein [Fimbriimonadaceae bacterium]
MPSLLELSGVSKSFVGTHALVDVDFDLQSGEIHALLGENGAGKSTLIKTLTGVYPPDSGMLMLAGAPIAPRTPAEAVQHGISTVYQEVNLLPNLTVMENLVLGREPTGPHGIRWREMRRRAESAMARLGISVDVQQPLARLSIAMQQMVAIARALDVSAKVLILDEPTSSLDVDEVESLFGVMRQLRDEGLGIIFVTHFLDQVYAVSDRITILRNGKRVGTWKTPELERLQLVSEMIGRDASSLDRESVNQSHSVSSDLKIATSGLGRRGRVSNVSLELRGGETLGLAGLLGSGRTETARLLFGIDNADQGTLSVGHQRVRRWNPRRAISHGLGYCSEDRKNEGIFPELTIRENIVVLTQVKRGWFRPISRKQQRTLAEDLVQRLQVTPGDIDRPIQFLSGGNQQKVLLARWLAVEPDVLILDEPTRGIDVGAKFEIMSLVESLRVSGRSFVFISSELAEVVKSCTKVVVMRDRQQVGTLSGPEVSEESIVKEIAGT